MIICENYKIFLRSFRKFVGERKFRRNRSEKWVVKYYENIRREQKSIFGKKCVFLRIFENIFNIIFWTVLPNPFAVEI